MLGLGGRGLGPRRRRRGGRRRGRGASGRRWRRRGGPDPGRWRRCRRRRGTGRCGSPCGSSRRCGALGCLGRGARDARRRAATGRDDPPIGGRRRRRGAARCSRRNWGSGAFRGHRRGVGTRRTRRCGGRGRSRRRRRRSARPRRRSRRRRGRRSRGGGGGSRRFGRRSHGVTGRRGRRGVAPQEVVALGEFPHPVGVRLVHARGGRPHADAEALAELEARGVGNPQLTRQVVDPDLLRHDVLPPTASCPPRTARQRCGAAAGRRSDPPRLPRVAPGGTPAAACPAWRPAADRPARTRISRLPGRAACVPAAGDHRRRRCGRVRRPVGHGGSRCRYGA